MFQKRGLEMTDHREVAALRASLWALWGCVSSPHHLRLPANRRAAKRPPAGPLFALRRFPLAAAAARCQARSAAVQWLTWCCGRSLGPTL